MWREAPAVDSATVEEKLSDVANNNGSLMPTHDLVESIVVSGNVSPLDGLYRTGMCLACH